MSDNKKEHKMIYDIYFQSNRQRLLKDADLDGDECPVDDICDSIPYILKFLTMIEGTVRSQKTEIQRLNALVSDLERKLNNVKSQKFRQLKKKNKFKRS